MSSPDFARARPAPLFDRWWNRLVVAVEIGVLVNVVAGLLGLFGTGPLSSAELRCANPPVTVAYQRITRRSLQSDLQISTTGPIAAQHLDVVLPRAFTKAFDVAFTSPPAHVVRTDHDGDVYTFDFGPSREGEIRIAVKARAAAWLDATLKIGDGRVPLRLVVLP